MEKEKSFSFNIRQIEKRTGMSDKRLPRRSWFNRNYNKWKEVEILKTSSSSYDLQNSYSQMANGRWFRFVQG